LEVVLVKRLEKLALAQWCKVKGSIGSICKRAMIRQLSLEKAKLF